MSRGLLHHGNLGIARSLGRLGVPVYLFQDATWGPISRSRYVRGTSTWNFGRESSERSVLHLLEIGQRIGDRPILIATDDASALFLAEHGDQLASAFQFPRVPSSVPSALASKKEMYLLCQRFGVPTPTTTFPCSREDVLAFVDTATFPVALKSIDARLLQKRKHARSVVIAHGAGELLSAYDRSEVPDEPNLMLQEYIPGGPESVWMFNGYFNAHSDCLVGFTGKKLRQNPPYTGATSLGVCLRNDVVHATTCRFMKAIGYRGILDIGYRYDARDGQYKLLDANPRIGATFRLFVASNGLDVARALYLDLTAQSVPEADLRVNRKWLVENRDVESMWAYRRDGTLSLAEWWRSLRGVEETAWFSLDDPAPFVLMCATSAVQGLRGLLARAARGPG